MKRRSLLAAAAAAAVFTAAPAIAAPVYSVGTGATYRPFEFQAPSKEIVGFDIDLMKEIAKAAGFQVKFQNTLWGVIFESVKNGDRDIIMSGITITPQRHLRVKSINDLKGKKVAVVANSAGDIVCSKAFGKASPNIKRFDNTPLALEELNAGGVDAAIGDVGVFAYYAQQNPGKHFNMTRDPNFEEQYFGIAVRKGNTKLLAQINDGLRKVYKNGTYAKVYHKWFGNTPVPKLPIK